MIHPIETAAQSIISRLRGQDGEVALAPSGQVLVPGLWGSFDAEEGALSGRYRAGGGALLRLEISAQRAGRWCTLAMGLGEGVLAEGDVIGLVADLRASRPVGIALCLRSTLGGVFRDVVFDDGFDLTPESGAQVALLTVPPGSVLSDPDQRLSLLMELPQTDIEIELRDMRLFVLPADGSGSGSGAGAGAEAPGARPAAAPDPAPAG